MMNNPFGLGDKPNFNFGAQPPRQQIDQHLKISEVAQSLSVSESTVKNWIAEGLLPAYRFGKRTIRITAKDVEAMRERVQAGETK